MGIQNDSQLELFSQSNAGNRNKSNFRNTLTGCFRNYEKIVILIICFLICCTIIFTLGVEKGKNLRPESYSKITAAPILQQEIKTNIAPDVKTANIEQETIAIKPEETIQQAKKIDAPAEKNKSLVNSAARSKERSFTESDVKNVKKGRFTVQLASYQNKTLAQKEAQNLKKNGYTPLIIPKGKYLILCVGNFTDESKAKSILSKLKKQYNDSRIRRL